MAGGHRRAPGILRSPFSPTHLAQRLGWQERLARRHHRLARSQEEINTLIIDRLTQGVLVVDSSLHIQQANPAACQLLGGRLQAAHRSATTAPLGAAGRIGVASLKHRPVPRCALAAGGSHLPPVGAVRARLAQRPQHRRWPARQRAPLLSEDSQYTAPATQFLVFLEDLRQLEARLRTEKNGRHGPHVCRRSA